MAEGRLPWLRVHPDGLVEVLSPDVEPGELPAAVAALVHSLSLADPELVRIRGDAPGWLLAALACAALSLAPAVAVHDPRTGRWVVVASHIYRYKVGRVVEG